MWAAVLEVRRGRLLAQPRPSCLTAVRVGTAAVKDVASLDAKRLLAGGEGALGGGKDGARSLTRVIFRVEPG